MISLGHFIPVFRKDGVKSNSKHLLRKNEEEPVEACCKADPLEAFWGVLVV